MSAVAIKEPTQKRAKLWQAPRPQYEEAEGAQKSFGEWLSCVARMKSQRQDGQVREKAARRLEVVYKTSLAETSGQIGGYLVPYEYQYGLMQDIAENSIVWSRAFLQPMQSKQMFLPLPDPTGSIGTNQVSNLYGGMQLSWKLAQSMSETEPKFRQVELNANELDGYLVASNDLLWDYDGLDAFLRQFIARSVAWFTDQAFFQGGGGSQGQPLGFVNASASIQITRQTSQQVTQTDVAKMMQSLLPQSWQRAVWALSPTALNFVMNLGGLGGILYFIPGEDGSSGMLFGRPFYVTEKLPDVGTLGDVVLFDPALYVIGHRGLFIDYSDQEPTAFKNAQSVWRVLWRGDGTPMLNTSITLANQSSTKASPYLVLR